MSLFNKWIAYIAMIVRVDSSERGEITAMRNGQVAYFVAEYSISTVLSTSKPFFCLFCLSILFSSFFHNQHNSITNITGIDQSLGDLAQRSVN